MTMCNVEEVVMNPQNIITLLLLEPLTVSLFGLQTVLIHSHSSHQRHFQPPKAEVFSKRLLHQMTDKVSD